MAEGSSAARGSRGFRLLGAPRASVASAALLLCLSMFMLGIIAGSQAFPSHILMSSLSIVAHSSGRPPAAGLPDSRRRQQQASTGGCSGGGCSRDCSRVRHIAVLGERNTGEMDGGWGPDPGAGLPELHPLHAMMQRWLQCSNLGAPPQKKSIQEPIPCSSSSLQTWT